MPNDDHTVAETYDECYLDLRVCREQFESIRADVEDMVARFSQRQLQWQPQGDAWSILECLARLSELASASLERVRELYGLTLAVDRHTRAPYRSHSRGPVLKPISIPLPRPTESVRRPVVSVPDGVVDAFRQVNDRVVETIDRASTGGRRAAALVAGIGHGLQLAALQHWRHILEARRVAERPGFPAR